MGIRDRLRKHRSHHVDLAPPALVAVSETPLLPSEPQKPSPLDENVSIQHFVESLEVPTLTVKFDRCLETRCENTGEWPEKRSEFQQWLEQDAPASYLWCPGKPGTGKSVIAAILFEHLRYHDVAKPDVNVGLAYAFFDYKKANKSLHEELARSLVFQLCTCLKGDYPDCIVQLSKKDNPTFADFSAALQKLTECFEDTRIVIDALDECDHSCQLACLEMFRSLLSGRQEQKVRLLLTSRKNAEIEDFYHSQESLLPCFRFDIRATDEDIKSYVNSVVDEQGKQKKQDGKPTPLLANQQLRAEVMNKLVENSAGMFLWAKLQVMRLKDIEKPDKISEFIRELPLDEEIEATYIQMVKRIEALPEDERRMAQRCLLWVAYAATPLSRWELTDAIHIEDASPSSEQNEKIDVLRICANFLEEDGSTDKIVFVHYSAVEFFKKPPNKGLSGIEHYFPAQSAAHSTLAKLCVKYLYRSFTEDEATGALADMSWFLISNQLAVYSCHYFDYHMVEHYEQEGDSLDNDVKECGDLFLHCENAALVGFMLIRTLDSSWDMELFSKLNFWPGRVSKETIIRSTRLNTIPEFRLPDRTAREEMEANSWILHHAAFSGDRDLVEKILDNATPEFISRLDARGATALYYAARQGDDVICRRLIARGINPDAGSEFSNPLQAAAFNGHLRVVQLLLEKRANTGLMGGFHNTPLQAAAWGEHYAIVLELLKNGNVNVNASKNGSARAYCALQAAAYRGDDSIVSSLVKAGAKVDIREPGRKGSQVDLPLQAAMQAGHIGTAQILLDAGADINAESGEQGVGGTAATALQAAAWGGHREAVKFLIERGANVKQIAGTQGSALHAAITRGWKDIVDILLENGADIRERVGKYGSSLQAAAGSGNEQLVRMALDAGINPNIKGGYFESSLIAAAKAGSLPIVTLLVEAGADLETLDHNYGTALDAATYARHMEVVWYLLEKGATVGGALIELASGDGLDLAEEFIKRGAGVNSPGRSPYEVPLQAAAWGAHPQMVKLLLDKGAKVNHHGGVYGNALQAAVFSGSLEVVKLLVASGADVNTPTGLEPKGTPLQCACIHIREGIARYLLENGAKPNVPTCGEFGTALQAAVVKNYEQMVTLLLDHGADVNALGGKYGTALQAAASNGNLELARLLIDRGAKVNKQGGRYGCALQAAAFNGKPDMVKLLLDEGADANAQGCKFGRPLQAAAYSGNETVVRLVLGRHAKVNAVSRKGYGTALHAAIQQGHEGIVKILLDNGAELLDNTKGESPLALAKRRGREEVLVLLDQARNGDDLWEDIGDEVENGGEGVL